MVPIRIDYDASALSLRGPDEPSAQRLMSRGTNTRPDHGRSPYSRYSNVRSFPVFDRKLHFLSINSENAAASAKLVAFKSATRDSFQFRPLFRVKI